MIEIALSPNRLGPTLSFQEERIDAVALRRKHRLDVLQSLLQFLERLGAVSLDDSRYRLESFAPPVEPSEVRIAAGDGQFRPAGADGLVAAAYAFQATGWNAHLFDLVARQLQCGRRGVEGFLDLLLSGSESHSDLQHRQLPHGLWRYHLR